MTGGRTQDATGATASPSPPGGATLPAGRPLLPVRRLVPLLLDLRRLVAVLRSQQCRPLRLAVSPVLERLGAEWLDRLAERLDQAIESFESLSKPSRRTKT